MKLLLVLTIIVLNSAPALQEAEFLFKDKNQRHPKVKEGVVIHLEYEFENKGLSPLVISDYKVGCPCTKVLFPKEPIMPGEGGVIKVSFDTKGKIGYQDRKIEIQSNAVNGPNHIRFRVMVDNK